MTTLERTKRKPVLRLIILNDDPHYIAFCVQILSTFRKGRKFILNMNTTFVKSFIKNGIAPCK